jgi:hypothetical protein
VRLVCVDQVEEGCDVEVGLDERLLVERLAVDADPLGHRLDVRAGEPAGAQPAGADERVDHASRAGLAVGAGEVHDLVGAVRVTHELGQGLDPVEAGLEAGLGPPPEEGSLHVGVRRSACR